MRDQQCQAESAAPTEERYGGEQIKDVTLHGSGRFPTHISIRLANNKYIEVVPHLSTCNVSINARLAVSRGGWLE